MAPLVLTWPVDGMLMVSCEKLVVDQMLTLKLRKTDSRYPVLINSMFLKTASVIEQIVTVDCI